jgi:tRNA nucleotidyltransferase/poly(A) polymerase
MQTFSENSYEVYAVGGSVRDVLRGKQVLDWDFTTNAKPEEIRSLFPRSFYNNTFGTVGIPQTIAEEQHIFEVTTYRKESSYTNSRHPDEIQWADNVEEDLARRDFTINALAYDGTKLIDPFGGKADLDNKCIKAVGNPDTRFQEDALRLLRAIRFTSQLGFMIEEKTRLSIEQNAHLITQISWERIRDEIIRIMKSDHPAEGILFMRNTGLLKHILPEVDDCFSVPQKSPKRHHVYDVGTHLVMSLKYCPSRDPITRFATLIHDVGKTPTFRKNPRTKLITFYNHEVVGKKMAATIAERLRLSKKQKDKLVTLVGMHQFSVSEKLTDKAIRRFIREVGTENLDDILALRIGDRIGSGAKPSSWRFELFKKRLEEVQHVPFQIKDLVISGTDVMQELGIRPGPEVGSVLKQLFEEVDEGKLQNEKEVLIERLKEMQT